jgi:presenilin-like A22 family membrane protease
VRTSLWDIVFVVVTVFGGLVGALVAALTFARARRARNQPFSNVAAVGVFLVSALFSITAVLLFWWFTGFTGMPWPVWAGP